MNQFRQGDLLFVHYKRKPDFMDIPADKSKDGMIIAFGEATGHKHKLELESGKTTPVYVNDHGVQFFEIPKEDTGVVTHEEHGPVKLDSGHYGVYRIHEYEPEGYKQVTD